MSDEVVTSIQILANDYDEKAMMKELALRAIAMSKLPAIGGDLRPEVQEDAEHLGVADDLWELGNRIFRRIEKELHEVVCGSSYEEKKDRESILKATGMGEVAMAATLYTALTASLGLAPAVATVVAALLIKRIFMPAGCEVCKFWGEKIAKRT